MHDLDEDFDEGFNEKLDEGDNGMNDVNGVATREPPNLSFCHRRDRKGTCHRRRLHD